jgi:hypothetical protein
MSNPDEIDSFPCGVCGIVFGFSKRVAKNWQTTHQSFYCPNGHYVSWPDKVDAEKEIQKLRATVLELEDMVKQAREMATKEKQRADELELELELYGIKSQKIRLLPAATEGSTWPTRPV